MENPVVAYFANPGQNVRIAVQTTDGYGSRVDGYVPVVTRVFMPDLAIAAGFPLEMARIDEGLYISGLVLPTGPTALGTWVVNVFFIQPGTGRPVWQLFTINVARPFGNSSASPI